MNYFSDSRCTYFRMKLMNVAYLYKNKFYDPLYNTVHVEHDFFPPLIAIYMILKKKQKHNTKLELFGSSTTQLFLLLSIPSCVVMLT